MKKYSSKIKVPLFSCGHYVSHKTTRVVKTWPLHVMFLMFINLSTHNFNVPLSFIPVTFPKISIHMSNNQISDHKISYRIAEISWYVSLYTVVVVIIPIIGFLVSLYPWLGYGALSRRGAFIYYCALSRQCKGGRGRLPAPEPTLQPTPFELTSWHLNINVYVWLSQSASFFNIFFWDMLLSSMIPFFHWTWEITQVVISAQQAMRSSLPQHRTVSDW